MAKNGDPISPNPGRQTDDPGRRKLLSPGHVSDDMLEEIRELRIRIARVLREAQTISKFFAA